MQLLFTIDTHVDMPMFTLTVLTLGSATAPAVWRRRVMDLSTAPMSVVWSWLTSVCSALCFALLS